MKKKESRQDTADKKPNAAKSRVPLDKYRKIAIGVAAFFLFYTIGGFFLLPPLLKYIVQKKLPELLHRQITLEKITTNPYTLSVACFNFRVLSRETEEEFIRFEQLAVDVEAASLFKRALVLKSFLLQKPAVRIVQHKDKSFNFSDLTAGDTGPAVEEEQEKGSVLFSLANLRIVDGRVTVIDQLHESTHSIENITLSVPSISNLRHSLEAYVEPSFHASVNNASLELTGKARPFISKRETVLDVQLDDLDIRSYLAYLPAELPLSPSSGKISLQSRITFMVGDDQKPDVGLSGNVSLRDIVVNDPNGTEYARLPHVGVAIGTSDLPGLDFHLQEISFDSPSLALNRTTTGDVLPFSLFKNTDTERHASQAEKTTATTAGNAKIRLDKLAINGGSVLFADASLQSPFETAFQEITVIVQNFTTAADKKADYSLSTTTAIGEKFIIEGDFSLAPFETNGVILSEKIQLTQYSPYLEPFLNVLPKKGKLDLKAGYGFAATGDRASLQIENELLSLTNFSLADPKAGLQLIDLPDMRIQGGNIDLGKHQVNMDKISFKGGVVNAILLENGALNLGKMVKETVSSEGGGDNEVKSGKDEKQWQFSLKEGRLEKFSLLFEDRTRETIGNFKYTDIDFTIHDFSLAENQQATLALSYKLNESGKGDWKGSLTVNPFSMQGETTLSSIPMVAFQPYVADFAKIAIAEGSLDVDGRVTLSSKESNIIGVLLDSNVSANDVVILNSSSGAQVAAWKELRLDALVVDTGSNELSIKEIHLQDPYVSMVVDQKGALNLLNLSAAKKQDSEEQSGPEQDEDAEKMTVSIQEISVGKGKIDFIDQKITPQFATALTDLEGKISGLNSSEEELASVRLNATLDGHSPITISGTMNPLREKIFADFVVDFKDVDLSPVSPYSGKHIGYKIEKGKLSLAMKYTIDNKAVTGKNSAFLDQFTIGETVESPDAVSVPLHLAVALLQNRRGEITFNIPVQGNLDDPEFSIGTIVFKALFNLIAKAATAPFALLGALIPDGAELNYVQFAPGSAVVSNAARGKLNTLAKALFERPGIRLELKGSVDPDSDRQGIREMEFDKLLKKEKYLKMITRGDTAAQIDSIVIEEGEYEKYLENAFKQNLDPEIQGKLSKITPEKQQSFMRKALYDSIRVSKDYLRQLAVQRTERVKDFLVTEGRINPERIFTVEPQKITDDSAFDAELRRVEILIK